MCIAHDALHSTLFTDFQRMIGIEKKKNAKKLNNTTWKWEVVTLYCVIFHVCVFKLHNRRGKTHHNHNIDTLTVDFVSNKLTNL